MEVGGGRLAVLAGLHQDAVLAERVAIAGRVAEMYGLSIVFSSGRIIGDRLASACVVIIVQIAVALVAPMQPLSIRRIGEMRGLIAASREMHFRLS